MAKIKKGNPYFASTKPLDPREMITGQAEMPKAKSDADTRRFVRLLNRVHKTHGSHALVFKGGGDLSLA